MRIPAAASFTLTLLAALAICQCAAHRQPTTSLGMAGSAEEPLRAINTGWPTYGYTLANTRHVDFSELNARTVHALALAWKFRPGLYGAFETSPIVVGRTMYITTGADNAVMALDATNGALLWRYQPTLEAAWACCGPVNRGVAVDSGMVFFATLDARLIALDARTGVERWETRVADPAQNYSETMAPLAWRGMVFIGSSGGERNIRGFFSAYSQSEGKLIWRWWSVAPGWEGHYVNEVHGMPLWRNVVSEKKSAKKYRDAWRHGGGSVWMTPAVDPSRSTIYLSVGNPSFSSNDAQPGDNLYTASIVALDALTGKMKWYYQEVPHDLWDYDAASPPVLFRTKDGSERLVSAVGEAGKTGWFYVLNRDDGKLIRISDTFVPQRDMFKPPTRLGSSSKPSGRAGAVAPVAFDPVTHLVFVQAKQGEFFVSSTASNFRSVGETAETLSAVDVDSGKIAWRKVFASGSTRNRVEGPLSAADVVFIGEELGGIFEALDARSGKLLWSYQTASGSDAEADVPHRTFFQWAHDVLAPIKHRLLHEPMPQSAVSHIHASPIAYVVDGREYIAIAADAYYRQGRSPGDTLYVFALPK